MSIVEKAQASMTEEREKQLISAARDLLIVKKGLEERLTRVNEDLALVDAGKDPHSPMMYRN